VGVGHDDIVEDYALTSATIDAFRTAAAERAERADALAEIPQLFWSADPMAMSRVLGDLEAAHGSVAGYVRAIGLTDDELVALADNVLTR